jgi:WD40 repeat protein
VREIPFSRAQRIEPITWSSDGRRLVVIGHQVTRYAFSVLDVKSGHLRSIESERGGAFNLTNLFPHTENYHSWVVRSWAEKGRPGDADPWAVPPGRLANPGLVATVSGPMLATGHPDGTIRLWRQGTPREVRRILAHDQPVSCLVSSPDGRFLLSVAEKATDAPPRPRDGSRTALRLWDVKTGKRCGCFAAPAGEPEDLRFSPDGRTVALLDARGRFWMWYTKTGNPYRAFRFPIGRVNAFAFSRDGRSLALARLGRYVDQIDLAEQRLLRRLRVTSSGVDRLEFLPDNRTLLVAGAWIGLWDVRTGREHPGEGHRTAVGELRFSPDGAVLASRDGMGFLRLWSARDQSSLPVFDGGREREVAGFRWGADASSLLTLEPNGQILTWSVPRRRVVRSLHAFPPAGPLDPDGLDSLTSRHRLTLGPGWRRAASCDPEGDMHLLHVASSRRVRLPFRGRPLETEFLFSPDEKTLAVWVQGEGLLRLWDVVLNKLIARFGTEGVPLFSFSPDSALFVHRNRTSVYLYDLRKRRPLSELTGLDNVVQFAFDPAGRAVLTITGHRYLQLWDVRSARLLRAGFGPDPELPLGALLPLPRPHLLTWDLFLDARRQVRLHDPATGLGVIPLPDPSREFPACCASASPDGRVIAVGGYDVTFHDRYTGKEVGRLPRAHRGTAQTIAFSLSGALLAVGASDSSVYLWDWKRVCRLSGSTCTPLSQAHLTRCWQALASDDPRAAFAAVGMLRANPTQALSFLGPRLKPVDEAELQPVRRLVADLDSDDFPPREQASIRLRRQVRGEWMPLLDHYFTDKPAVELSQRLRQVLHRAGWFPFSPGMLRRLRAVHLLEEIGTPEAVRILARLGKGDPFAPLTGAARDALGRLPGEVK